MAYPREGPGGLIGPPVALSGTPLLLTSVSVDGIYVQKKSTLIRSFWALGASPSPPPHNYIELLECDILIV